MNSVSFRMQPIPHAVQRIWFSDEAITAFDWLWLMGFEVDDPDWLGLGWDVEGSLLLWAWGSP